MDTTVLEDIGLAKNEITIFLTLLKIGETKAGPLIAKSRLQSSAVYNGLTTLIEKGLISYVKKSNTKHYKAADPDVIYNYLDLKKRELSVLLPELKVLQQKTEKGMVEYFEGFKGIKTILSQLFKTHEKKAIYRYISVQDREQYETAKVRVFRAIKQLRLERKIITKGILPIEHKGKMSKSPISTRRFVKFPMPPNTHIYWDKVAIITWGEEPKGVLIESKEMAEQYTNFFEHLWQMGEK